MNSDGVWCYYDDSRITENVDPKDVVTDAAYVLYYRRRDVVVSDFDFLDELDAPVTVADSVADHMDSRVRTPSETSSTHAAQGDDMDVDIQHSDVYSNASSKTYSSPMDSHDGDTDNNYTDTDGFAEGTDYYDSASGEGDGDKSASYPLQ